LTEKPLRIKSRKISWLKRGSVPSSYLKSALSSNLFWSNPKGSIPIDNIIISIIENNALSDLSCHCHLTPQMITAVGGLTGLIPGVKISGINAGRGSMNAVYKQMSTKFARGQISSVSTRTALKMFAGRATDTAVLQGTAVGTLSGLYAEPLIPGYSNSSSCDCK